MLYTAYGWGSSSRTLARHLTQTNVQYIVRIQFAELLQISQPQLPTVPVSSILLGPAAAGSPAAAPPSSVAAGPITDGGIDLVSQIKVPVSIPATAAAAPSIGGAGKKRRSGGFPTGCKYSAPPHHQGIIIILDQQKK